MKLIVEMTTDRYNIQAQHMLDPISLGIIKKNINKYYIIDSNHNKCICPMVSVYFLFEPFGIFGANELYILNCVSKSIHNPKVLKKCVRVRACLAVNH